MATVKTEIVEKLYLYGGKFEKKKKDEERKEKLTGENLCMARVATHKGFQRVFPALSEYCLKTPLKVYFAIVFPSSKRGRTEMKRSIDAVSNKIKLTRVCIAKC